MNDTQIHHTAIFVRDAEFNIGVVASNYCLQYVLAAKSSTVFRASSRPYPVGNKLSWRPHFRREGESFTSVIIRVMFLKPWMISRSRAFILNRGEVLAIGCGRLTGHTTDGRL
jgi:hypothetical protein